MASGVVLRAAQAAANAASTATLALRPADISTTVLPVSGIQAQQPAQERQDLASSATKNHGRDNASRPKTQSLPGSKDEAEDSDSFEEIGTQHLSRDDRKIRRDARRKRKEDAEYNRTIDLLDDAFGPSLLLHCYGGKDRRRETQGTTLDILRKVGGPMEGGSSTKSHGK